MLESTCIILNCGSCRPDQSGFAVDKITKIRFQRQAIVMVCFVCCCLFWTYESEEWHVLVKLNALPAFSWRSLSLDAATPAISVSCQGGSKPVALGMLKADTYD